MLKIVIISTLLVIGFCLDAVSMFTNEWIRVESYVGYTYYGIVPFRNEMPFWFRLGSVLMYCSFASYLIMIPLFVFVVYRFTLQGYSYNLGIYFNLTSIIASIVSLEQFVTFLIFAINSDDLSVNSDSSLGYSTYLALLSAISTVSASGLIQYVRIRDCR